MAIINLFLHDKKGKIPTLNQVLYAIPAGFRLPANRQYLVCLDQSTTCTGIYVRDIEDNLNLVIDMARNEGVHEYVHKLFLLVKMLVKERDVRLFVYEALPVGAHPNIVLEKLHNTISGWRKDPAFKHLPSKVFDDISPSMWKSHVFSKDSGKNFNIKRDIAESICEFKPHLLEFLNCVKSKDYDCFDAIGILEGYLREHYIGGVFSPENRQIGGDTKYWDDIFLVAGVVDDTSYDRLASLISIQLEALLIEEEALPYLHWNPENTIFGNLRKSLTYDDFVITSTNDPKVIVPFEFRYDLKVKDWERMFFLICRSSKLKTKFKKLFNERNDLACELIK